MKTLKISRLLIALSLFLSSCVTVDYLGDSYPATTNVDVYYDAKDVKPDYKVIGHLTTAYTTKSNDAKNTLSAKARTIGADGIIILQVAGNNDHSTIRADAIKYNK